MAAVKRLLPVLRYSIIYVLLSFVIIKLTPGLLNIYTRVMMRPDLQKLASMCQKKLNLRLFSALYVSSLLLRVINLESVYFNL